MPSGSHKKWVCAWSPLEQDSLGTGWKHPLSHDAFDGGFHTASMMLIFNLGVSRTNHSLEHSSTGTEHQENITRTLNSYPSLAASRRALNSDSVLSCELSSVSMIRFMVRSSSPSPAVGIPPRANKCLMCPGLSVAKRPVLISPSRWSSGWRMRRLVTRLRRKLGGRDDAVLMC
jgi:hypothetical protein